MTRATANFAGQHKRCGFRLSPADALVIAAGAAATWLLRNRLGEMAALPAIVLAHFFLFCNVFRVRRRYELIWAAAFVVNLLAWQAAGAFSWFGVLLAQAPVTFLAIAAEMKGNRYHGVGWRWINPTCCSRPAPVEVSR
jgi:hypothetical protein